MDANDTIAAIATAAGEGGISIVRVSGAGSLAIADAVFRGGKRKPSQFSGGTFVHGVVRGEGPGDADEVVLLVFRKPRSYTREDVVEFQCHGGSLAAQRVLRVVFAEGARQAGPGEFTRRAFLNGRIDLVQAEAVADLVAARSERAATAALEQLEGNLSKAIAGIYEVILDVVTDLEATLDFEEEEVPEFAASSVVERLESADRKIRTLLDSWEEGRLLRQGAQVAIAGLPNVGKSTLLNRLLGVDRAIVSEVPGTTRDTIEESVVLEGIAVRLIDTAGLRDADCHIEREGVARAENVLQSADLTVYVVDASRPLDDEDRARLAAADPSRFLVVLNKIDLGRVVGPASVAFPSVSCSLLRDPGVDTLRAAIARCLHIAPARPSHATISERHRQCLQNAQNELNESKKILAEGRVDMIVPLVSVLRESLEALGEISGRAYGEELLDRIFSRFCIGK